MNIKLSRLILILMTMFVASCATTPPSNLDNVCEIFREKKGWYKDAKNSYDKWGIPIPVLMATMHQESRFVHDAQPPREKLFGFIPWFRPSNAYGYTQALTETWGWYQEQTGNYGGDRDEFGDAADFVGWYHNLSHKKSRIAKHDAYNLYLAYHEGQGGFNRKTYLKKQWLINVSRKVSARSKRYASQLKACEKELQAETRWFFGLF